MRKLVSVVLASAVLTGFLSGCGANAAKDAKETQYLCPICGEETQLTEDMKRLQREL